MCTIHPKSSNLCVKQLLRFCYSREKFIICTVENLSKGIVVIVIRAAVWEGSLCGLS